MNKKKIIIVCRSFYPDISPRSFRATELAKELARQGHEVIVCLPRNNYDYTPLQNEYGIIFKFMPPIKWKPVPIIEKGILYWPSRILRRILQLMLEYPDIELIFKVKRMLKKENGFDLLISIAVPYPIHWGVALVRSHKNPIAKVWIADCGDPFYFNTLDSFKKPFYFAFIEKFSFKKANYITIPFDSLKKYFFKEFHNKIRIIPQGFKFEIINTVKNDPINVKPRFAYAGSIAMNGIRSPFKLIEILLQIDKDYEFHIFTLSKSNLLEEYAEKSKNKIVIHNSLQRSDLIPILSKMDFLVNLLVNGTELKQIPSKLIDYSLAGRPILNIDPINPNKEILIQFLNGNYQNAFYVKNIEQYRIENVCEKFLELLPS